MYTVCTPLCAAAWWRHQMEAFSALLTLYAGNSPVTGECPSQRPVTRSLDVFDLRLNKRLSANGEAGDYRRQRTHDDVIVMCLVAVEYIHSFQGYLV